MVRKRTLWQWWFRSPTFIPVDMVYGEIYYSLNWLRVSKNTDKRYPRSLPPTQTRIHKLRSCAMAPSRGGVMSPQRLQSYIWGDEKKACNLRCALLVSVLLKYCDKVKWSNLRQRKETNGCLPNEIAAPCWYFMR